MVAVGEKQPPAAQVLHPEIRPDGEVQHHLVYLRVAVALDAEDAVLPRIQHGEYLLGVIARRQVVPGAVVQQVSQQHQTVSPLPLHQVQQLPAVQGAAVDVRRDPNVHKSSLLSFVVSLGDAGAITSSS